MEDCLAVEVESTRGIAVTLISGGKTEEGEREKRTDTIFEKLEKGEPKLPAGGGLRGGSWKREGRPAPRPAATGPSGMKAGSISRREKLGRALRAAMPLGLGGAGKEEAGWRTGSAPTPGLLAKAAIFAWREGGMGVEVGWPLWRPVRGLARAGFGSDMGEKKLL